MDKPPLQESFQDPDPLGPAPPPAKTVRALLSLLIIALGAMGAIYLVRSAPKAARRPPVKLNPLVSVMTAVPEPQTVVVHAMGTVVPARQLMLKSRVGGQIVGIHAEFTEGGLLRQGDVAVEIDDRDYKLLLAQKQSAVVDARYALKIEEGHQEVARREWELLKDDNPAQQGDADLALRKPHLEKARADLAAAEAELAQARLELERTKIYAPFNAIVRGIQVEKGSQVAAQENLATLVDTDKYWIKVSIPVDRLQWIDIPRRNHREVGSLARIDYQAGATRQGRVIKLLSDLEDEGRMARLLVAVQDPLGLHASGKTFPPMLIGEYVRVQIQGRQIGEAYRIPRGALRDNNHIWVVDEKGRFEIREVETLWRDTQTVLLQKGLTPGERVVVSDLATPVSGMTVRIEGEENMVQPAMESQPAGNQG